MGQKSLSIALVFAMVFSLLVPIIPNEASAATVQTVLSGPINDFSVSQDGNTILFSKWNSSKYTYDIWFKKPDGSNSSLYSSSYDDVQPFVSADGSTIGFVVKKSNSDRDVYFKNLNTGKYLYLTSLKNEFLGQISGDGSIVVWGEQGSPTGDTDVFAKNLNTNQVIPIPNTSNFETNPIVSGDGSTIFWRESGTGIKSYKVATGVTTTEVTGPKSQIIVGLGASRSPFSTSYDGSIIVWGGYDPTTGYDIYGKNLTTGEIINIANSSEDEIDPQISPDGSIVIYKKRSDYFIYGKKLPDGPEFQITDAQGYYYQFGDNTTVYWSNNGIFKKDISDLLIQSPMTPQNFKADLITTNSITLSWDVVSDATQYELKRNGSVIYSGTSVTFSDTGLSPETLYNYSLIARNNAGDSLPATLDISTLADTTPPTAPTFSQTPTSPTNGNVTVTINYSADSTVKQYKIGSTGTWTNYTGPITLTSNNTVYAKGQDSAGNWSSEASYVVSNIDKTPPTAPTFIQREMSSISAGNGHSLALKSDETVWAWGLNDVGQLGDGTTTNRTTPVQVSGLTDVVAVAKGAGHSLALKSDRTVWAWGLNNLGQLGDGTTMNRISPVQVLGVTDIVAIAAWNGHSLALKSDGTVWAWGRNNLGQLGDGTTSNRISPVQVQGLTDVVDIAAGYDHSLALKSDGTVWAWGYNGYGQLGDGTTANRTTPVQVQGLTDVVAIAPGYYHSLALKSDGTVWAWGYNGYGQLGDGTTANRTTPFQVQGLTEVVAIAAGYHHSLALKSDGTVWAWGLNDVGQLGDGTTTNRRTPFQVQGLTDVVAIAAGYKHSLALKSDGTVWAWGRNNYGQLGDATTINRTTPVQVQGLTVALPTSTQAITINFSSDSVTKEFRIGSGTWANYTGPITVTENTTIEARATDAAGNVSLATYSVTNIVPAQPNLAIDNVTASQVVLSWNTVSGATEYELKRNGTIVYTGTNSAFTDTGLTPNTTYAYSLVARNSGGDSSPDTLSATTFANVPINLVPSEDVDSITLTWEANGNPTGTEYFAQINGTSINSGWITDLSYTFANLTPGQAYLLEVKSRNKDGIETSFVSVNAETTALIDPSLSISEGIDSIQAIANSANPPGTEYQFILEQNGTVIETKPYSSANSVTFYNLSPSTSYTVKVQARYNGGLSNIVSQIANTLALDDPSGFSVTGKTTDSISLRWNIVNGATEYVLKRDGIEVYRGSAATFTDSGLTPNTAYLYTLTAKVNLAESSGVSISEVTKANVVSNIQFTNIAIDGFTVTYSANGNPGGTEYLVTVYEQGSPIKNSGWVTDLNAAFSGLKPNTNYNVEVVSRNQNGEISSPVTGTVTTDVLVINPVSNIQAIDVQLNQVTLSWEDSQTDVNYIVKKYQGSNLKGTFTRSTKVFTDTNVTANTTYTYQVIAKDLTYGIESVPVSLDVTTPDYPAPDAPTNVTISSITDSGFTVSWDSMANTVRYYVDVYEGLAKVFSQTTTNTAQVVTGLKAETNYLVKVRGVSAQAKESQPTDVDVTTLPLPVPVTIDTLNATVNGSDITLDWNDVSNRYGYYVERWKGSVREVRKYVSTNSYIDSNVPAGTYTYKVIVYSKTNGLLDPVLKEIQVGTTGTATATPVANLQASINNSDVTLTWDAISGVYGYYVERYSGTTRELRQYVSANSYIDSNVPEGAYTYKVIAYSSLGMADPTSVDVQITSNSNSTTVQPLTVQVTVNGQDVSLSWNDVGSVYGFYIERWKGIVRELRKFVNTMSYVDSAVPSGNYVYKVIPYSSNGFGAEGTVDVSVASGSNGSVDALQNLQANVNGFDVSLTWDALNGIYGYYVERWKGTTRELRTFTKENSYVDSNVFDGDYVYRVIVYSSAGFAAPVDINVTVNNQSSSGNLGTISNVQATVNNQDVTLTWDALNNVYGYYVERYKGTVRELRKYLSTNTFVDVGVASGDYTYKVIVYSQNGFAEPVSVNVTVGSPNTGTISGNITNLQKTVNGSDVTLTWDNLDNVYGYYVERWESGVRKLRVYVKLNSYMNSGLTSGSYIFKVIAYTKDRGMLDPVSTDVIIP
ncbi:fibronectin type III domain-containing protein [Microaerobacter geothermalis]|uniref:RCC1 domain-containing protein n=1 Tax=Microaerobacter geothermalis TaxID=674972 RepID=UPI001F3F633F|nr:fibronectin type III domain-containing protein [Microaerobacter geothermalis]MCF6094513.1 fibronectin type III domain-containing protein [Microaerobacter geothermalis]